MCANYDFLPLTEKDPEKTYPLNVLYCGICGFPPEFCEFGKSPESCGDWYKAHLKKEAAPTEPPEKPAGSSVESPPEGPVLPEISICLVQKGESVQTRVSGLREYDVDLKAARKFISHKLETSATYSGFDLILQGDCAERAREAIAGKWRQIGLDKIVLKLL